MSTAAVSAWSRYRALLGDRAFAGVLASSVLARMPLGMNTLAILLFMRARTGSFLQAGIAVGAYTLANAAAAPVQGKLLDRLPHRQVLLACALIETGLLLALVLAADAGAGSGSLIALVALAGGLMPPVSASMRSLWPAVVYGAGALESAYALDATSQEVIWTLGPVIVGACTALASASAAIVVCAVFGLVGTSLFAAMPPLRAAGRHRVRRAGAQGALRSRGLRALFVSVAMLGVLIGALDVGLPALAAHLNVPSAAGVLLAMLSVGSMAGGLLYGARAWRVPLHTRQEALMAAAALMCVPLLLAGSLPGAILLTMLAGVTCAPVLSCQYALVEVLAPEGSAAEAFNWHTAALVAGIAAGTAAGGALVEGLGVSAAFLLASGAMVLGALSAVAWRGVIGARRRPDLQRAPAVADRVGRQTAGPEPRLRAAPDADAPAQQRRDSIPGASGSAGPAPPPARR
jgi:MFS family permease